MPVYRQELSGDSCLHLMIGPGHLEGPCSAVVTLQSEGAGSSALLIPPSMVTGPTEDPERKEREKTNVRTRQSAVFF